MITTSSLRNAEGEVTQRSGSMGRESLLKKAYLQAHTGAFQTPVGYFRNLYHIIKFIHFDDAKDDRRQMLITDEEVEALKKKVGLK